LTIDSDFLHLIAEGQDDPSVTRDKQVAALLVHARHTSQTLTLMTDAVQEIQGLVATMAAHVKLLQSEMVENTQITTTVRDTITAGRIATQVIKWVGGFAIALAGIYGAWLTFRHGGGVGPGDGPGAQ